jgi:branched-chain amino acid transport system substrate-binding protein
MMGTTRPNRSRRALAIALIGATVLVAACGSDDDSGSDTTDAGAAATEAPSDTTAATDAPEESALGAPNAATGEPLTIGYVSDGVSDTVDRSSEVASAQAAAEYVNAYLGGVAGRPIELDVCETGSTPAGAADCVTQMVNDGVPIVLNGLTNVPGALYPPLAAAGITVFSGGALEQASLSTPGISLLGNAILTVLAGPAQVAADAGITQAAIAVIDNPAASGQLEAQAPLFYGNVGVGVDVVAIPIDTPDVTPQITAELTKNPGLFQVIGDPPFCGKVMRALDSAGYDGKIVVIPNCLTGGAAEDLPNLEGSVLLGTNSTDPDAPEVILYQAVLDEFADGDIDPWDGGTLNGFQVVVALARALEGMTGDVTSATLTSTIEAAGPTPYPIADGLTFQCNHTAVTIAPNICTNSTLQTVLDAEGAGTEYTVLDGTAVLTLGG